MPSLLYFEDRGVAARSYLALALWHLGFPDRAVAMSEEAISIAREFEHPYNLAFALCFGAVLRQYRREPGHVLQRCEAATAIAADASEAAFAVWQHSAMILRGWALAEMGDATAGITAATQGLDGYIAVGFRFFVSYFTSLIGEVYLRADDAGHALVTLAQGLAHVEKTGEDFAEAELHRLMAEAMARRGGTAAGVQERFDTAIAAAQRQATGRAN